MPWTVDDSIQRRAYDRGVHYDVPASAMSKYHKWKRLITDLQVAPKVAADQVGDMHFEGLKGRNNGEYTIRLSQQHRVAFKIEGQVVNVFQIGGHYPNETN